MYFKGIIFADDLLDDEDMLMINEDGQLCSVIDSRSAVVTNGAIGSTAAVASNTYNNVNTFSAIHPLDAERYISQPNQAVQCQECFRLVYLVIIV